MKLCCPKCSGELKVINKSYICHNKHTYDIAKQGYVNLLLNNNSNSGDDILMVQARHAFLTRGYYRKLLAEIIKLLGEQKWNNMLDIGCGEGYYTNNIANVFSDKTIVGLDISKLAIKIACKNPNIQYLVASSYKMPFKDDSFDVCLSIFAPYDIKEVARLLKDDGIFIVVGPMQHHLWQLKEVLYDDLVINDTTNKINLIKLSKEIEVCDQITIDNQEMINNLFTMTPYFYKSSLNAKKHLKAVDYLKIDLQFLIRWYVKNPK